MPDLQLKRGTPSQLDAYVGPAGEIVADSQNWNIRLQDGITPGGFFLGDNASLIATPEISSPTSGSVIRDPSPIITSTAYSGEGIHVASQWQLSKQASFTSIAHDSGRDTVNLTSYSLLAKDIELDRDVTYHIRVRHESGIAGWSDWSLPTTLVVESFGVGTVLPDGGIIFAQEGGDWLVVAPASQHVARTWNNDSSTYVDTPLPNVSGTSGSPTTPNDPNSSKYNTDVLVGVSQQHKAATYCRSIGYDLPNAKVLKLIYNNRSQINAADSTGNLPTTYVWSSTESSNIGAWALNFNNDSWNSTYKDLKYWVVPIKRIPV